MAIVFARIRIFELHLIENWRPWCVHCSFPSELVYWNQTRHTGHSDSIDIIFLRNSEGSRQKQVEILIYFCDSHHSIQREFRYTFFIQYIFFLLRMPKRALILCLIDYLDEDFLEVMHFFLPKRKKIDTMYIKRREEGAFSILIERYLFNDHEKFTSFLRVTPRVFYIILKYVNKDIYVAPCNRVTNPIDPSQKLCIALR